MHTQEQWTEMMHLKGKTDYLVGLPKELGFVPQSKEVLFVMPEPNPWLEDFLDRRAGEIDAMFAERHYRFCYLPRMAAAIGPERLAYNRPGAGWEAPRAEEVGRAAAAFYKSICDKALTPLPQAPMLMRYKKRMAIAESGYAAEQRREANYVFSHRELPGTQDEGALMDFFADYIAHTGEELVLFSLAKPPTPRDKADYDFEFRVEQLEEEIRARVEELRQLGVAEVLISNLFRAPKPPLSRLTITKDFRIVLSDYENREVKMTVLPKVLYFFYLNHPEGVLFKELADHEKELMEYYMTLSNRVDIGKMQESIRDLVDSEKNSVNEKSSLIRSAFLREFDEEVVRDYLLTSDKEHRKRVPLDRSLVVDESGVIVK